MDVFAICECAHENEQSILYYPNKEARWDLAITAAMIVFLGLPGELPALLSLPFTETKIVFLLIGTDGGDFIVCADACVPGLVLLHSEASIKASKRSPLSTPGWILAPNS